MRTLETFSKVLQLLTIQVLSTGNVGFIQFSEEAAYRIVSSFF